MSTAHPTSFLLVNVPTLKMRKTDSDSFVMKSILLYMRLVFWWVFAVTRLCEVGVIALSTGVVAACVDCGCYWVSQHLRMDNVFHFGFVFVFF